MDLEPAGHIETKLCEFEAAGLLPLDVEAIGGDKRRLPERPYGAVGWYIWVKSGKMD